MKHLSTLRVLTAFRAYHAAIPPLAQQTSAFRYPTWLLPTVALVPEYPRKVVLRKIQRLVDEGLLAVGVSYALCWLTDEGRGYLEQRTVEMLEPRAEHPSGVLVTL